MIVAWDLAPRKCGWCAGDGSQVPTVDGLRLSGVDEDFGQALERLRQGVLNVHRRFKPTHVLYESPILPGSGGPGMMGSLAQRRAQFAQGAFLEWICWRQDIPCFEVDLFEIKQALTGNKMAEKADMVAAALRLGIQLPEHKVDGREDAADAVGAWLVGVRHYAKQFLPEWDRRVYSPRGGFI